MLGGVVAVTQTLGGVVQPKSPCMLVGRVSRGVWQWHRRRTAIHILCISPLTDQNEVDAKRANRDEMTAQRHVHDEQISMAGQRADVMKMAYDKLNTENVEQRKMAAQVSVA